VGEFKGQGGEKTGGDREAKHLVINIDIFRVPTVMENH